MLASSGRKKTRPVPVDLGVVEVRLVPGQGPTRVTVRVDAQKVQQGLAALAQREAGQGGKK